MARSSNQQWQVAMTALTATVVGVVVIACLYWAQSIFIPMAVAVYLSFLLSPVVTYLHRRGIGRVPAVAGVMLLTLILLGALVWVMAMQVTTLTERLAQGDYESAIQKKLQQITDPLERFNRNLQQVLAPRPSTPEEGAGRPATLWIWQDPPSSGGSGNPDGVATLPKPVAAPWVAQLPNYLMPAAHLVGGGALAVVLTAFMLLKREDLRNRLIRLAGQQVTVATRALDEAGQRISRFLLMQALIGAATGAAIGLGLLVLRVEYALLWGFLVFVLRYVPYVGIWFAALPPILLSLAGPGGWGHTLLVAGWILVVEMAVANIVEPMLFGRSIGVSEVALLVAAAFWAFLWGPIGMVLSSPITVCLIVLGKYHPQLKFLDVLLGDEPALSPQVRFYQRLLARDQDEAEDVVQAQLKEKSPEKLFDEVLMPALAYARRDRENQDLSDEDEAFILKATREIGDDLAERMDLPRPAQVADAAPGTRAFVLACPARDAEDELTLQLLSATLDPTRWQVQVLSEETLGSELLSQADEKQPDLICIATLPPGGVAHTRYLCKRLRSRFPDVKILVCAWDTDPDLEKLARLSEAGADLVTTSLAETRQQMHVWLPVLADTEPALAVRRQREAATV